MARPPIKGSEDRYATDHREEYLAGREARMSGVERHESPYGHQPHDAAKHAAWLAGWRDEDAWALDSTGR